MDSSRVVGLNRNVTEEGTGVDRGVWTHDVSSKEDEKVTLEWSSIEEARQRCQVTELRNPVTVICHIVIPMGLELVGGG